MGRQKRGNRRVSPSRPKLTPEAEAGRREREAKLAEALRMNLRRRKVDLARRNGSANSDSEHKTILPAKKSALPE